MDDTSLRSTIESVWDRRDTLSAATQGAARDAVEAALEALDTGRCGSQPRARVDGPCTNG